MSSCYMYTDGDYLKNNPTWDVEDAPWKAALIYGMIQKHHLNPRSVCEVGCGSGEILYQLQQHMPPECTFIGYEISSQAIELCKNRADDRLCFRLKHFSEESGFCWDLILLIDLIEHLEDYFSFLRESKEKRQYTIVHLPLEMFVLSVLYPQFLLGQRKKVGHLHFFSRETALQTLRDLGDEIVDYSYTAGYALPREYGLKDKLLRIPRGLLFPLAPVFTSGCLAGIHCW